MLILKVISTKIVEKDFSNVVTNKQMTKEETLKELEEQYKFEPKELKRVKRELLKSWKQENK